MNKSLSNQIEEMKTTQYFEHTRTRPDRALIKGEWITFVVKNPIRIEIQSDGRIKKWAKITEVYPVQFTTVTAQRISPGSNI